LTLYPRQKAPVPTIEKDGQGPVPKWTGVEKRKSLSLTAVKIVGLKVKHFAPKNKKIFYGFCVSSEYGRS
jgi:hypothetical protein